MSSERDPKPAEQETEEKDREKEDFYDRLMEQQEQH